MVPFRPQVAPCAALCMFLALPALAHAACGTQAWRTGKVARVLDAHTLRLEDGAEVRLVGALAPETPPWWKGEGPWPTAEKARAALEKLIGPSRIELRFAQDEARRDRHGRYLAQVYVLAGKEPAWAQGGMVTRGEALAYSFAGHRACARALQAREAEARANRRGLWRSGGYRVMQALDPAALARRTGRFQIVEGRVAAVAEKSQWTFLNFTHDWHSDFTVAVRARDRRAFSGSGVELAALAGRMVRVRGWIERWNGPVIKATHPEQIEVLEETGRPR